jgi:Ca-activated chloride channel family protein
MQFEQSTYLWFLLAVPLTLVLFLLYRIWRNRAVAKMGDELLIKQLMDRYSWRRKTFKLLLLLAGFSLFVIGLANLRSGSKKEMAKGESAEVIICFDVSNSMLAEDVKPDRLTQAKFTTSQLIEKLAGNKLGLIVFAGKSYVQMPLSNDARAALMYLNTIHTDMVPTQGTAIGDAIATALTEFEEGGEEDNKGKAIIIITDGESHDENAMEMATEAGRAGIKVFTIGIGTKPGGPIPYKRGNITQGFKKDKEGSIILSRLNEGMLQDIAEEADGFYINASAGRQVIQKIQEAVDQLDKSETESFEYAEYANHFQVFLIIGLLLMTVEFFMSDKIPLWIKKIDIFKNETSAPK